MQHPSNTPNGSQPVEPLAAAHADSPADSHCSDGAMDRRVLLGLAGIAGAAALAKLAKAGPLEPPPGQISSTGATLGEIFAKTSEAKNTIDAIPPKVARTAQGIAEPRIPITACPPGPDAQFVISQPGAYYLPSNLVQQPGLACIDIQCSDVSIDGQGFSFLGTGSAASPPSTCVRSSSQKNIELCDCSFSGWVGSCCDLQDCDDCAISDVSFRMCTCPPGYYISRSGHRIIFDDCDISQCSGNHLCGNSSHLRSMEVHVSVCHTTCGDDCCIEDCTFSGSSGGVDTSGQAAPMLTCANNCCITECDFRKCTCSPGYFGASCVVESCEVTGCVGDAFTCGASCCIDDCTVMNHLGRAVVCADGSCITECDFRQCTCPPGEFVVSAGASCVIECCEVTGGSSSSAISCGDNSSVEDCSVTNHQGAAISCGASCCVCQCRCVGGFSGISCGADCDIDDNEVSVAPSNGTVGGGAAISVSGARGRIVCNYVKRGGITLFDGSNGCVVEDNTVVGGDGPPGTDGGFIALASTVTGCFLRGNTARRASMTHAFIIPPGNTFGPVVNAISGGSLESLQGGSSVHCNCVHF